VSSVPDDLYAVPWTRADGTHLLMFWSAAGTSLNFPAITDAVVHDPLTGSRTPLSGSQGVTLLLKPTLQILEWKP
ncbi:beta-xylosidase, partial [Pseudomonas syringae pv. syringae FF5]